jgi:hypothetical protein
MPNMILNPFLNTLSSAAMSFCVSNRRQNLLNRGENFLLKEGHFEYQNVNLLA